MTQRRWSDLSAGQRTAVLVVGAVEISLAVSAWRDLAVRSAREVNGSKKMWAAIIAVNVVGPLSYYRWGRRPGRAVRR